MSIIIIIIIKVIIIIIKNNFTETSILQRRVQLTSFSILGQLFSRRHIIIFSRWKEVVYITYRVFCYQYIILHGLWPYSMS